MEQKATPVKTWQLINSFRRILGDQFLNKLYQRGTRQLQRWSADPNYIGDSERNPLDRIEAVLTRLMDLGRDDIAMTVVARQAQIVGCELSCMNASVPDKDSLVDEILDDHPPLVAFHQAIRNNEPPVTVHELYQAAKREIEETYALYARTYPR